MRFNLKNALILFASCAALTTPASADEDLSVYHAFGDKAGLARIMDDFMVNLLADTRISAFFAKADPVHLKAALTDQFCAVLNGPCKYAGRPMDEVHEGQHITEANFNALVEDLQAAMNKHEVPFSAQNKLLARLAPMHRVVIAH